MLSSGNTLIRRLVYVSYFIYLWPFCDVVVEHRAGKERVHRGGVPHVPERQVSLQKNGGT